MPLNYLMPGTWQVPHREVLMNHPRIKDCAFRSDGQSAPACCGSEPTEYTVPQCGDPHPEPGKARSQILAEMMVSVGAVGVEVRRPNEFGCRTVRSIASAVAAADLCEALRRIIAETIDTENGYAEHRGEKRGRKAEQARCVEVVTRLWDAALKRGDYDAAASFRDATHAIRI